MKNITVLIDDSLILSYYPPLNRERLKALLLVYKIIDAIILYINRARLIKRKEVDIMSKVLYETTVISKGGRDG